MLTFCLTRGQGVEANANASGRQGQGHELYSRSRTVRSTLSLMMI